MASRACPCLGLELLGILLCVLLCDRRQAITLPEAGNHEMQLLVHDLDISVLHAGSGFPTDHTVPACPSRCCVALNMIRSMR